jgi:hypothetical protein
MAISRNRESVEDSIRDGNLIVRQLEPAEPYKKVEEVPDERVPQRRLLLVASIPVQLVTDDLRDRHPIDPPLRKRWSYLSLHSWLDRVYDEEPVEVAIPEQAHGAVEVLREEHREPHPFRASWDEEPTVHRHNIGSQ